MKTKTSNSNILRFVPKKPIGKKLKDNHPPQDFLHDMLHHPNVDTAVELIGEQTGLIFDHEYHGEIAQIKLEQDEINENYKKSSAIGDRLVNKKNNTDEEIKSTNDDKDIPFKDWKTKDKVTTIFIFPMILIAMAMGYANTYSSLISSGNPVYIQKYWITIALSALIPVGSFSIKFLSNQFEIDRHRKRYSFTIYILTFIMLIFWSVLFALNFSGASGQIDWNNIGETSQTGSLLTWTQIALEMLMASGLALALEDIASKYSHDKWIANLKYTSALNNIKAHRKYHKKLRNKRNKKHARLIELEALRQTSINKKVAEYVSLRARFNKANTTSFNF